MKYLSKCLKGNTVFIVSLIAYLNSYVKNYIYFQTIIYMALGILLLIEALHVFNLNWKAEKNICFLKFGLCFFVGFAFFFDGFIL